MERLPVCLQVSGTGEEAMVSVVCSYDDLSRKLWNLKGLPLTVTAVQGVHPALRYTDVSVRGHSPCMGGLCGAGGRPWTEGEQRMSHSLLVWLLRALEVVQCVFFAVPSLVLAVHKLVKPSVLGCFAGAGVLGRGGVWCWGFLLPGLSPRVAVLSQVFPPIPMKPIYSFHTQIKTKHLLLPSEEKPCPAYIAPLTSKWGAV